MEIDTRVEIGTSALVDFASLKGLWEGGWLGGLLSHSLT